MSKNEKQQLLNAIDGLSALIENDSHNFVKEEHRKGFKVGQLSALLMIREKIEYEEYK